MQHKIIILLSLFSLLTPQTATADAASSHKLEKRHNEKVKKNRYDLVVPLPKRQEYARVKLKDKWGLIDDVNHKELIPPKYDEITDVFFMRNSGPKPPVKPEYVLRVKLNGKWGYADFNGKEVVPVKYDEVPPALTEPLNRMKENGKYGYLDIKGNEAVPAKYDEVPPSLNQKFNRIKLNGKYGYLDNNGNPATPARYDDAPERLQKTSSSDVPVVRVSDDGKYGYLSRDTGEEITPVKYDIAPEYLVRQKNKVKRDGMWGYIDKQGTEVSAFQYEDDPCAFDKKNGEHYVFGEHSSMRSQPDPNSAVIAQFPAGAKIKVRSGTEVEFTQGDEADKWYEASSGEKKGYVWGGDIADSAFTVLVDAYKLLFLIRNRTNGIDQCYKPKFEMKMLLDGKVLSEYSVPPSDESAARVISMEYVPFEGFTAPLYLLKMRSDFKAHKDAYARFGTGVTYFYIDDGKLKKVLTVAEEVGGEGKFKDHKFIGELELPDNRGRVDKIVYSVYSSAGFSKKLFSKETYQWDWDEKTFKPAK